MDKIKLPNGIDLNSIKCKFVEFYEPKKLMNYMNYHYDDKKSYHRNCVDFFNTMMQNDRLCELWDAIIALSR